MTPEQIVQSEYGFVKFVRIDEEYRFCSMYGEHKSLLKEGESAISAGFLSYDFLTDHIMLSEEYSYGLQLGPMPDDEANIKQILLECKCTTNETNKWEIT